MVTRYSDPPGLPETNSIAVTRMAVAWNIFLAANYAGAMQGQQCDKIRETVTKAYIETYNAILENERSQDSSGEI